MKFINQLLGRIENHLFRPWFNPFATLYINLRLCRITNAVKFPIFIYGRAHFDLLNGNIIFHGDVKTGMIKFGQTLGHFTSPKGKIYFFLKENSTIIFEGSCFFSADTSLRLTENSVLRFGDKVMIGDSVKIICEKKIEIGENTRITFGSQIIDTNFHYIVDLENNTIQRKNGNIKIGANNWIGNHSSVMKGAETEEYCILASGSLLNKKFEEKSIILAGTPAKMIDKSKKRIFSVTEEHFIDQYFDKNPIINKMKL